MPQVIVLPLDLKDGYSPENMNLFLPFCIHESEDKSEDENRLEYELAYFKQTIEETMRAYPGKVLNILVADTLDDHNREEPTAKADGDEWLRVRKPILDELQLIEGEHYNIHRWNDFLIPARKSGYLEQFEKEANKRGVANTFRKMAKKYQEKLNVNYKHLESSEKEHLIKRSYDYFIEDYGVTFFIADLHKPVLFFADKQNRDIMNVFSSCNALRLNGSDGMAHLQLRLDIETLPEKDRQRILQRTSGNVVAMSRYGGTIFNGNGHHTKHQSESQESITDAQIQGLQERIQALRNVRRDVQRMNEEQIKKLDQQIDELLDEISHKLSSKSKAIQYSG